MTCLAFSAETANGDRLMRRRGEKISCGPQIPQGSRKEEKEQTASGRRARRTAVVTRPEIAVILVACHTALAIIAYRSLPEPALWRRTDYSIAVADSARAGICTARSTISRQGVPTRGELLQARVGKGALHHTSNQKDARKVSKGTLFNDSGVS